MSISERLGMSRVWCCLTLMVVAGLLSKGVNAAQANNRQSQTSRDVDKLAVYDVVSIKPSKAWHTNMDSTTTQFGAFIGSNMSAKDLIEAAFGVKRELIYGAPSWCDSRRYDVRAKMTDASPDSVSHLSPLQRRKMLQNALAERFKWRVHNEQRMLSLYELRVSRRGEHLKLTAQGDKKDSNTSIENGVLSAHAISLHSLADTLSSEMHTEVVDKTGLEGSFDVTLNWAAEPGAIYVNEAPFAAVNNALKEQLGLELHSSRGPVEILVVDNIEKPDED